MSVSVLILENLVHFAFDSYVAFGRVLCSLPASVEVVVIRVSLHHTHQQRHICNFKGPFFVVLVLVGFP